MMYSNVRMSIGHIQMKNVTGAGLSHCKKKKSVSLSILRIEDGVE